MGLGELGLMPDEFWSMTSAELTAKIRGYVILRDTEASNIRNLYTLLLNVNRQRNSSPKKPQEVWPLDIDDELNAMSIDDRLEWYKKVGKHKAQC